MAVLELSPSLILDQVIAGRGRAVAVQLNMVSSGLTVVMGTGDIVMTGATGEGY